MAAMAEFAQLDESLQTTTVAVTGPSSFFDAHYHWWDLESRPNPVIEGMIKRFGPPAYLSEMLPSCEHAGVPKFSGGVVVESTISMMEGMPHPPLSAIAQSTAVAEWITTLKQTQPNLQFRYVAFANLCDASEVFETDLLKHRAILENSLSGVRMILNYDADDATKCWPGISQDALLSPTFRANFALLQKYNLSFDLQCNPTQLASAAELCRSSPTVKVCLNHIGLPKFDPYLTKTSSTESANATSATIHEHFVLNATGVEALEVWKEGIKALADSNPHVCIKISMLGYAVSNWWTSEAKLNGRQQLMDELVGYVMSSFGPDRCMIGSNWPVDDEPKIEHVKVLKALIGRLGLSEEQLEMVWHKNAKRFYQVAV